MDPRAGGLIVAGEDEIWLIGGPHSGGISDRRRLNVIVFGYNESSMKAHVHYEAAFEDFLRKRGVPYVAVDEARRAEFREAKLKSFDFIVYSASTCNWLADVKGRRWAARKARAAPRWENWITRADIDGLTQWQEVFGAGFRALLIFAYWIDGEENPPAEIVHAFRDARYVFAAVPLDDYSVHARIRSPKWGTVNLPAADFSRLVRPIDHCL